MKDGYAPITTEIQSELVSLIETLHETERRVEALTAGQVDSVADRAGRPLMLRKAQDRMRTSDAARQSAILDALPARIALLDSQGCIVSMNQAWLARTEPHVLQGPDYAVGDNYLRICDDAFDTHADDARRAAVGIRDVLERRRRRFTMDYVADGLEGRSFQLSVSSLDDEGGPDVVLMHVDTTDQKRSDHALRRFAGAMEAISDAIFLVDRESMRFVHVNEAACQMQNCRRDELLAREPWAVAAMGRDALEAIYDGMIATGIDAPPQQTLTRRRDGSPRWIEVRRHAERSASSWNIVTLARDVTQTRVAAEKIVQLSRVHAMLTGINALAVRVRDREELAREACRISVRAGGFPVAWVAMLDDGVPRLLACASNAEGEALASEVGPGLLASGMASARGLLIAQAIREKRSVVSNDMHDDPVVRSAWTDVPAIQSIAVLPLLVGGAPIGVFALHAGEEGFFHDEEMALLTELAGNVSFALDHLEKQEQLTYLAYYDALTGLANRSLFLERVRQHIRAAVAGRHRLALFIVNLERFKALNDSLGQPAGDSILRQVADCLSDIAGGSEHVARMGADHFAIVLPLVREGGDLNCLIEATMARFIHHSFVIEDSVFRISLRAGISLYPDDGSEAETLFRNAEAALKRTGLTNDRYLFYTPTMTASAAGRLALENKLRRATDNEEFVLHYQPKVDLVTGKVVGAEGLIRWMDPASGLVPPGLFIPVLEETGLIDAVGRWALRQGVEDYLRWCDLGLQAVPIAINVSPLQLRRQNFVAEIRKVVAVDQRAVEGLELEITESVIVEDIRHNVSSLNEIRAMGIRVAIDDFGTGFSSLSYLSHLPIDALKIDRSFVIDLARTKEGQALVSTIISLAHALKLTVVAEGVETEEQRRLLALLHCDQMQGFLFSRPVPRDEFETRFLGRGA